MPPCPGMLSPKSLMPNARLKPEAKNPPKGATSEAKMARTMEWSWKGAQGIEEKVWPVYRGRRVREGMEERRRTTS